MHVHVFPFLYICVHSHAYVCPCIVCICVLYVYIIRSPDTSACINSDAYDAFFAQGPSISTIPVCYLHLLLNFICILVFAYIFDS